jgi:hypothetical protein
MTDINEEIKTDNMNVVEEKDSSVKDKDKDKSECTELKNIKYKTMLMNGNIIAENKSSIDLCNLEKFLEDNKSSTSEQWSKLDKTLKTQKILVYAEKYTKAHNLTPEENVKLILFLKDCLDKKKINRVKDVNYNKVTGEIIDIPVLLKLNDRFTLKNNDKRVSTIKCLMPISSSCTSMKKNSSVKNKVAPVE